MKKWFLFAAVGVLVIILMAIGLRKPALQDEIALPDYLHTDFTEVTKIEIRYSDGNLLTIEDSPTISKIVSVLKEIRLQKSSAPAPVGFLYFMDIVSGSQTVRYGTYLVTDHTAYHAMAPQSDDLDALIISIGHEHIPGLLPGIETPN